MKKERIFLTHILEQTELILDISSKISWNDFESNKMYQYTFIRAMEIIGEAAKHISEQTREQHADIPFREMAGLRDRLIHGYFSVDPVRIWEIAENDIPELNVQLRSLLSEISPACQDK